jgi:8-oxo-dGTP diphosphatase/2-hydroxy-dATP diphosphatase
MKKRGFGEGRWNGFGGKVQEGETIEQAAEREVQEECGLTVRDLKIVGQLDFEFHNNPGEIIEVHIYRCDDFEGELQESEEMLPKWFNISSIPYDKMWTGGIHWLPLFLQKKCFTGCFVFGENDVILRKKIFEVKSLNSVGSLDDL